MDIHICIYIYAHILRDMVQGAERAANTHSHTDELVLVLVHHWLFIGFH